MKPKKKKTLHQRNYTEMTEIAATMMKQPTKTKTSSKANTKDQSDKLIRQSNVSSVAFNTPLKRSKMEQSSVVSSNENPQIRAQKTVSPRKAVAKKKVSMVTPEDEVKMAKV